MTALFLPQRWRTKPVGPVDLDWNHPLAQGLIGFYLAPYQVFAQGAGPVSLTDRVAMRLAHSRNGLMRDMNFANTGVSLDRWAKLTARYSGSMALGWMPVANGNSDSFGVLALRSGTSGGRIYLRRNSNGTAGFGINSNSSQATGPAWPLGVPGILACSWSMTGTVVYFNGKSFYRTGTSPDGARTTARIGNLPVDSGSSTQYTSYGLLDWAAMWSTPTGDGAHSALAENPWQIIKPRVRQIISLPGPSLPRQIARPTADLLKGAWTPSSGTELYPMLNEAAPDDASFISTEELSSCDVKLGALAAPTQKSAHRVRYRLRTAGAVRPVVRLMQGVTTIVSWDHEGMDLSDYQTVEQLLTDSEAAAITDYANLSLRFVVTT